MAARSLISKDSGSPPLDSYGFWRTGGSRVPLEGKIPGQASRLDSSTEDGAKEQGWAHKQEGWSWVQSLHSCFLHSG